MPNPQPPSDGDVIDTPRRIAFWAGLLGVIAGYFLMQHLFETRPELGQVTIYALASIPPFAAWGVGLTLARHFTRGR
ncbi:hypothetical protein L2U69_02415 [Zavarzinia compransoris]|uniref:hypothetical protein n=1 Tax=Zavarzinia marina TaxID=2911065 RepID=UPI001F332B85|nr:hypothetical protein [Zavarzinia marina]MCF4164500.1 hypothetical protein [Zavarzinia marina]